MNAASICLKDMKNALSKRNGRYSIVVDNLFFCAECGRVADHIHEIFKGTANKKKSIEDGMCIGLCARHHQMYHESTSKMAVEMRDRWTKRAQKAWEEANPGKEFIRRYGRNYVD